MTDAPSDNAAATEPTLVLITLLGVLTAFSPLAIDMYLPAFPQIEADLRAPVGAVAITLSAFLAGLACGQFIVGPLSDRVGRRLPLMAGCAGFAAAAIACTLAPSLYWFVAARFVMGACGAAGLVVSRAIVRDRFNETRSAAVYSFMMMITGIAPIVAPIGGGAILAFATWRTIFWVLAAIGGAGWLAVATILDESLPLARRSSHSLGLAVRRCAAILLDRRFTGYALAIGCTYGALFAYISGAPTVFMEMYGLSSQQFSLLFAVGAVGIFLTAQLNRVLLRRFHSHAILRVAALTAAVAGCLLVLSGWLIFDASSGRLGFLGFYSLLLTCIATLGLIFPNATAAAMTPFADEAGSASAVLGLTQYGLGALGGAAVGLLHTGTALPMAITIASFEICVWLVIVGTQSGRGLGRGGKTS